MIMYLLPPMFTTFSANIVNFSLSKSSRDGFSWGIIKCVQATQKISVRRKWKVRVFRKSKSDFSPVFITDKHKHTSSYLWFFSFIPSAISLSSATHVPGKSSNQMVSVSQSESCTWSKVFLSHNKRHLVTWKIMIKLKQK